MSALLELRKVSFAYDARPLFQEFDFALFPGQKIGLMGPNGAGKTTFLRLLVGLERPEAGQLLFRGAPCEGEEELRALRREVGFVFQDPDYQLFCPTVEEDLAFGPLNLGLPRGEVKRRVEETLALLGLEGFEKKITYRLSGGEKRLVALGTVLTMEPQALLLDEPTGDLDPKNILKLQEILLALPKALLVVSHDQAFLETVCEEVFWLEKGQISPLSKRRCQIFDLGRRQKLAF